MNGVVQNVVNGIRAIRNAIASLINAAPPAMLSRLLGFDVGSTLTAPLGGVASGIEAAFNYGSSVVQRAGSLDFGGGGGGFSDISGGGAPGTAEGGGGEGSSDRVKKIEEEVNALEKLKQTFNGLTATLENFSGWRWEEILGGPEEIAEIDSNLQGLADGIGNSFGGLFTDLVQGTRSAGEAFRDFFNSILDSLISTAARMISQYIAIGIARQFAGLAAGPATGSFGVDSGSLGSFGGGPFGSFPGLAIGGSFAEGGRPPVGVPSLVGEEGPELFVPSTSGTIVPNGQLGGVNSVVNVTINSDGSTSTDASQGAELGRLINSSVTAILMRERRPGGMLAR
jgi:hypothetical protein